MPKGQYTRSTRPAIRVIGPSIAYITLTQGFHALVDAEDADDLEKHKWQASHRNSGWYAYGAIKTDDGIWKLRSMHGYLLNLHGKGYKIVPDHINHNGLDNRKQANLRQASRYQNSYNARLQRNNRSGVRGVNWNPNTNRWIARITDHGKRIGLGNYPYLQDAIAARLVAESKLHGEFIYNGL